MRDELVSINYPKSSVSVLADCNDQRATELQPTPIGLLKNNHIYKVIGPGEGTGFFGGC